MARPARISTEGLPPEALGGFIRKWDRDLGERTQKEIQFAENYMAQFNHGTDGHGRLLAISMMAKLLDNYQIEVEK